MQSDLSGPPTPPAVPHPLAATLRPPSRTPWVVAATVAAVAGVAGYWGWGERTRLLAEVKKAEDAAHTAQAAEKAATAHASDLEMEKAKLEGERTALMAERETLSKSVEEKTTELASLKGATDKLREQMKDEIAKGDIQLTESGDRLRVGLVDKILFDSGAVSISKRGEGVLARVGAILAGIDDRQIQVSGHTDNTPISDKLKQQFPTNWELSMARATNVVRFLQDKAGVPPERLVASGHGEFQPVAKNQTAAGRAKNRRIELLLTPTLAPHRIPKTALKERAQDSDKAEKAVAKKKKGKKKTHKKRG